MRMNSFKISLFISALTILLHPKQCEALVPSLSKKFAGGFLRLSYPASVRSGLLLPSTFSSQASWRFSSSVNLRDNENKSNDMKDKSIPETINTKPSKSTPSSFIDSGMIVDVDGAKSSKFVGDNLSKFEANVKAVMDVTNGPDLTVKPAVFKQSELSITNIWDLSMWDRHTSRFRYARHVLGFPLSRLMRRIYPQLLFFIVWSIISVSFLSTRFVSGGSYVPIASLGLVSTFIGFLLTLRSNQGLDRLGEGRQLWGRAFIATRDTAQLLAAYAYPKDKELGLLAARYLSLFTFALKGRLRDSDVSNIVDIMLPNDADKAFMLSQRKKHIAVIAKIRHLTASLAARNVLPLPAHDRIETNLYELNFICGMCERLRGSPIPPVYTSHTSRLLVFYLFFLPWSLVGMEVPKVTTVLITSAVAFAMLGLDEISHLLEQPFRLMPLHQLSRNVLLDIADAIVCQPSNIKSSLNTSGEKDDSFIYPFDDENPAPVYW